MRLSELLDAWRSIVGPQIADVCEIASYDITGALHLVVSTDSWLRDLSAPGIAATLFDKMPPVIDGVPLRQIRWHLRPANAA